MNNLIKNSSVKLVSRVVGISLIMLSFILILITFFQSTQQQCVYPDGSSIASIDVSGLDAQQSAEKLRQIYEKPILLEAGESFFEFSNADIGFRIHIEEMLSGLDCGNNKALEKFWLYLWSNSVEKPINKELSYSWNEEILRTTIREKIRPRIAIDPAPAHPIQGTTRYVAGKSGIDINQQELEQQIKNEALKIDRNLIKINLVEVPSPNPDLNQIEEQVKQILVDESFQGVVEIYAERLSDHKTIQILNWYGEEKEPGVAFTAASTMKIPILLSTYWRQEIPLSEMMLGWIEYMIIYSENDPADRLMEQIDPIRGPLIVTNDIQSLGLENSFLAGYFYLGAPLLNWYETPANQRNDAFIDPDVYNQTTAEDSGRLLSMIYDCSENEVSELSKISQNKITQDECGLIIDTLAANKMGALLEAGLPEGIKIAHKHGWSQEKDGLVHSFSDVGIVYGPEEDFVLTIFTYSQNQLLFDVANPLIARITQTIYNGFNPNHQISWPFPE